MMIKHKYNQKVSNDEIDLSWFVNEFVIHRTWFIIGIITAIIIGITYIKITPEVYEASSSILIKET